MTVPFGSRGRRIALAATVTFALAGGIAYASIPDTGTGVYHACLADDGKIRIIDPATDQCKSTEREITFNQKGIPGPPGPAGAPGVSPTVTQLAPGNANCPTGGAAITDASHNTAYVCNGQNGADGQPFSGTFTSPNGQYSIAVTDTGVTITGAGNKIGVTATGVRVETHGGDSVTVMRDGDVTLRSGLNATLEGGFNTLVKAANAATVQGGASTSITGGAVTINGGTCSPAARVGDSADGSSGSDGGPVHSIITTGSSTVCIG